MLRVLQNKGKGARILLGAVGVLLGLAMVITLLPGSMSTGFGDQQTVVEVDGRIISLTDIDAQMRRISQGREMPAALRQIYARQVLDQMVDGYVVEAEARRLGIEVTREEQAERIRRLMPAAQAGDLTLYAREVSERTGMGVAEFEEAVRSSLVQEKIWQLVTDGIGVTPEEVSDEFRRRNEKIKLEYVLVRPDALESGITPTDADLSAYFEKNKTKYQVPEKRSVRYAVLEMARVRQNVKVTDADLQAYYNLHIDRFRLENRAHVNHILLKTVGKTDAEVEEIRQKAEGILKKARNGARFKDLAKQYSEDAANKDKGGDLGWILRGQTVAEFEKAAFTLPKGSISDLVKTLYGFHIIRVVDREEARTQTLEEVRASIFPEVLEEMAAGAMNTAADKVTEAVRRNLRRNLDDLAKELGLRLGESAPVSVREPVGDLGSGPELDDAVFSLRPGELGGPIRVGQDYVVLYLKETLPAHPGTLAEVRSQVLIDLRREKAAELARKRAEEIASRAKSGTSLASLAKSFKLEAKTSEPVSLTGNLPDIGNARSVATAFSMHEGQVGPATSLGVNWVIYRVVSREAVKPEDTFRLMREASDQVLQSKRQLAFSSFTDALRARLTDAGKIRFNQENVRRLLGPTS